MDIANSVLLLTGLERIRIHAEATGAEAVETTYAPWSHSLPGATVLAAVMALLITLALRRRRQRLMAAVLVALVVVSHWLLDVLAHPDGIPVIDHSVEVGLGMPLVVSIVVESVLLLVGLAFYIRATRPVNALGRFGMPTFVVAVAAFNIYVATSTAPATVTLVALSTLAAHVLFAVVAWWLDRQRIPASKRARSDAHALAVDVP
ncbi:hypothetical protein [Gulosibacter molinativorax]|nr:hypothetical protein [Gulosibacter molinativorax]